MTFQEQLNNIERQILFFLIGKNIIFDTPVKCVEYQIGYDEQVEYTAITTIEGEDGQVITNVRREGDGEGEWLYLGIGEFEIETLVNIADAQHYRFDGSKWIFTYLATYNPGYWRVSIQ